MPLFTDEQNAALKAPLDRATVRSRNQGGRAVSYIEGWHAIAEANRIFGFDGWTRETVEMNIVAQFEREIGQQKHPGWQVSYIAKVRINVGGIMREGYGTGHGIDRDLGQAHESACKEAETDAMKRALMTFGNPFGLALYDKDQNNVADAPATVLLSTDIEQIEQRFINAKTIGELNAVMTAHKPDLDILFQQDEAKWTALSKLFRTRKKELENK